LFEKEKMMSHPDPLFDYDNSEDDKMATNYSDYHYDYHDDFYQEVEDYNDYYIEENSVDDDDYDDSMDGDHDSAMTSAGWGTDEDYGSYHDDIDAYHDYYGEDF
jgi:hypothetical protein